MNRRIAKKILRTSTILRVRGRGYWRAHAKWMRDVLTGDKRRLGRWCPAPPEFREHMRAQAESTTIRMWWLSFCDGKTGAFLGACQVPATNMIQACKVAHYLGCNPGGEVKGMPVQDEVAYYIPEEYIGVLMDQHACEVYDAVFGEKIRDAGLRHVGGRAHLQSRSVPQEWRR